MKRYVASVGTLYQVEPNLCQLWRSRISCAMYRGTIPDILNTLDTTRAMPMHSSLKKFPQPVKVEEWDDLWHVNGIPLYDVQDFMDVVSLKAKHIANNWLKDRITLRWGLTDSNIGLHGWTFDREAKRILLCENRYEYSYCTDPVKMYIRECLLMDFVGRKEELKEVSRRFVKDELSSGSLLATLKSRYYKYATVDEILRLVSLVHPGEYYLRAGTPALLDFEEEIYSNVCILLGTDEEAAKVLPKYLLAAVMNMERRE